jgi:O-antigen/teichoic acid export membrane protein
MPTQTKKITLDTASLFFGKILGMLIGMVRLNYMARYLGVANFGILNFALYFCSLFQILFDLGTTQLLTRELARDPSKSNEFVGKAILMKILVVFAAGLIVGIASAVSHFESATNWAILLTTVVFAINGVSLVFLSAFQAHRKMTIVSLYNILNDLLISILVILFIGRYPFVITVLIFTIIVALANFSLLFYLYVRQVGYPHFQIDLALWKDFLQTSIPFAISSFGISMYTFIGATVLKYSRGDIEVGIYSAGYKFISMLTLIPTAFTQVLFPIFADFYSRTKDKLGKALADSLRVMSIVSLPIAVGTVILAPKIFALIYAPEYFSGIIVLQIMIVGIIVGYLNWILYSFIMAIDRQVFQMILSACVGAVVILLSLIFVPKHGYIALPVISIITESLLFFAGMFFLRSLGYRVFFPSQFIKPLLSAGIMGIGLLLLKPLSFLILVPIGTVIYGAVMFVIHGFGEQEKEMARKIFLRLSSQKQSNGVQ